MGKARWRKKNRVGPKVRRPAQLEVLKAQARKRMGENFLRALVGMGVPEIDPRFNRKTKISPLEFFITVGPGDLKDKYYACIMKIGGDIKFKFPNDVTLEDIQRFFLEKEKSSFVVVAKMKAGYDTAQEARDIASEMLTSMPVLMEDGTFEYPNYKEESDGTEKMDGE